MGPQEIVGARLRFQSQQELFLFSRSHRKASLVHRRRRPGHLQEFPLSHQESYHRSRALTFRLNLGLLVRQARTPPTLSWLTVFLTPPYFRSRARHFVLFPSFCRLILLIVALLQPPLKPQCSVFIKFFVESCCPVAWSHYCLTLPSGALTPCVKRSLLFLAKVAANYWATFDRVNSSCRLAAPADPDGSAGPGSKSARQNSPEYLWQTYLFGA